MYIVSCIDVINVVVIILIVTVIVKRVERSFVFANKCISTQIV